MLIVEMFVFNLRGGQVVDYVYTDEEIRALVQWLEQHHVPWKSFALAMKFNHE